METTNLKLPKPYLSWSQIRVWMEDRQAYRDRYYRGITERSSRYMMFGSEIAKSLEDGKLELPGLTQYPVKEYQLNAVIDGVPVFGYADQYDPERIKFREIKTGMPRPDGSPRWTDKEVSKHGQLDLYSLLLQEKHGRVDDECHLDWLHTRNKVKTIVGPGGLVLESKSRELELTGEVTSFARVITQDDRDRMRATVKRVALEISEDYAAFLQVQDEQAKPVEQLPPVLV